MKFLVLTPAYGRVYNTSTEAVAVWNSGADLRINDFGIAASYCSKRDIAMLQLMGYSGVQLVHPKTDDTLATVRF